MLSSVLTPEDFAAAEQVIAEAKPELIQALHRDGIPLGRIALYQLAIRSKRINLNLADDEWDEYLIELRNTVYAWLAARRLIDEHKPDRVIVYNGLYSVNRAGLSSLPERAAFPPFFSCTPARIHPTDCRG